MNKIKFYFFCSFMLLFLFCVHINAQSINTKHSIDYIGTYSEGLAPAGTWDGKWKFGYIDKSKKWIIQPQFDDAKQFSEGISAVGIKDETTGVIKYGYIKKDGSYITKPTYCLCENIKDGFGIVTMYSNNLETYGFVDSNGVEIVKPRYQYASIISTKPEHVVIELTDENQKSGLYDTKTKKLIEPKYYAVYENAPIVSLVNMEGARLEGMLLENGTIIEPQFESVSIYKDIKELADKAIVTLNGKYGIMDLKNGNYLIKPECELIKVTRKNLIISKDKKVDIYDYKCNRLTNFDAQIIQELTGTNQLQLQKDGLNGIINLKGEVVLKPVYNRAMGFDSFGNCIVSIKNKYGVIKKDGTYLIEPKYDYIESVYEKNTYYYYAQGQDGNKKIYQKWNLNKPTQTKISTNKVIVPKFDDSTDLYGFVDNKGKWVIQPQFYYADKFSEGLAAVALPMGKIGFIDINGNFSIEPSFHSAYVTPFHNGRAAVCIVNSENKREGNLMVGLIDKKGNWVVKPKHKLITRDLKLHDSIAALITDNEGKGNVGFINWNGNVVEPQYNYNYVNGLAFLSKPLNNNYDRFSYSIIKSDGSLNTITGFMLEAMDGVGTIRLEDGIHLAFMFSNGKIIKDCNGQKLCYTLGFSEGIAAVKSNDTKSRAGIYDQWGFLKSNGEWLVPLRYSQVTSFYTGLASVSTPSGWGVINKDGSYFIAPQSEKYSKEDYNLTKAEYNELNIKCTQILSQIITPSMSEFEKLNAIHNYVLNSVKYDYDQYNNNHGYKRYSQTAYGALFYGSAVCEGYAKALDMLLNTAGIESQIITGTITSNQEMHAWNLVKINGVYYHVDSTWNDSDDNSGMNYFLVSDKKMQENRTWEYSKYASASKGYFNDISQKRK